MIELLFPNSYYSVATYLVVQLAINYSCDVILDYWYCYSKTDPIVQINLSCEQFSVIYSYVYGGWWMIVCRNTNPIMDKYPPCFDSLCITVAIVMRITKILIVNQKSIRAISLNIARLKIEEIQRRVARCTLLDYKRYSSVSRSISITTQIK